MRFDSRILSFRQRRIRRVSAAPEGTMIKTIYELSTAVVFGATSWALKQVGNGVGAVADRILGPEPDQAGAEASPREAAPRRAGRKTQATEG